MRIAAWRVPYHCSPAPIAPPVVRVDVMAKSGFSIARKDEKLLELAGSAGQKALAAWTATGPPAEWMRIREQWEYTHAARFVLQLAGFSALLVSVLAETPGDPAVEAPELGR